MTKQVTKGSFLNKKSVFYFQGFTLKRVNAAMKLTTDAVLLGAWTAKHFKYSKVLDIGTGTGILSLILADREKLQKAQIWAIDIDKGAIADASLNFNESPYKERLFLKEASLSTFYHDFLVLKQNSLEDIAFDLIISNPPYFKGSKFYNEDSRKAARSQDTLSAQELFVSVKGLLKENGFFTMIIPKEFADEYISEAHKNKLFLQERVSVASKAQNIPYVELLAFSTKNLPNKQEVKEEYLFNKDGSKSDFWEELTASLYLNHKEKT